MSTKEIIRSKFKAKRAALGEHTSLSEGQRTVSILRPWMNRSNLWLIYSPVQNEISTKPLFDELRGRKQSVGFPRIKSDRMVFHEVGEWSSLVPGTYSLEPPPAAPEIDVSSGVIVVPGLAFSISGHRLGFGRGYYDRFLNEFPHFFRLGLAYDFQLLLEELPTLPHDETLDLVVCPSGLWGSPRTCASQ